MDFVSQIHAALKKADWSMPAIRKAERPALHQSAFINGRRSTSQLAVQGMPCFNPPEKNRGPCADSFSDFEAASSRGEYGRRQRLWANLKFLKKWSNKCQGNAF